MIKPSLKTYAQMACGQLPEGWHVKQWYELDVCLFERKDAKAYVLCFYKKMSFVQVFTWIMQHRSYLPKKTFLGLTGQGPVGETVAQVMQLIHRWVWPHSELEAHVFATSGPNMFFNSMVDGAACHTQPAYLFNRSFYGSINIA